MKQFIVTAKERVPYIYHFLFRLLMRKYFVFQISTTYSNKPEYVLVYPYILYVVLVL